MISAHRFRSDWPSLIGLRRPLSRTQKKNGTMKSTYQSAVNGPTARVPSRSAASSPKIGGMPIRVVPVAPFSLNKVSIKISATIPPR